MSDEPVAVEPPARLPASLAHAVDACAADLDALVPRGAGEPGRCEVDSASRLARIAWSCIAEPGDTTAGRLVGALGPVASLVAVLDDDPALAVARAVHDRGGEVSPADRALRAAVDRWRPRADLDRALRLAHAATRFGAVALVPGDAAWPDVFDDLGGAAPLVLWLRGASALEAVGAAAAMSVAVVGSRAASSYGERVAIDLTDGLTRRGCAIVSGGAYGIDIAAHRAALATGAPQVAVLAGGIDRLYPQGNAAVLERIADGGGAVIAEAPCGQSPTKWRFLQRNRLIAALARATVVIEAGARSGALNTAAHAAELGRPLGAVPGPVTSASSVGCHTLLREFDATLVTGAADAFELVQPFHVDPDPALPGLDAPAERARARGARASRGDALGAEATRAWDALSERAARTAADVAERSGLSLAAARGALVELELAGRARGDAGAWRRRAR